MKEFFFLSPPPFLASLWPLLSFHYFTCHFDILAFGASFDGNRFGFEFEFLLRCFKYCAISFYKIEKTIEVSVFIIFLPGRPEGHNMLEYSPILTCAPPLRSDWPESQLHNYTNAVEAGDSHRCVTSLVASEPPCSVNDTGLVVEELILGNFRGVNSGLVSRPNSNTYLQPGPVATSTSVSQWVLI